MNAGDQIHLTGTGSLVIDTTNASPGNISAGSLAVGTGNLTLIGESITIEGPSGTLGGNVTVTANNGITINGGISAPGGSTLSADIDANGTGNLTVNGLYDTQGSNGTVTASDVIITGTVTSGSATNNALLKFIQTQDGTIGLGDGAGAMNISGTELGKITTGALQFGNFPLTGGAITVDNVSAADTGNIGRIDLFSGQNVTFSGAASNFDSNLRVLANGSTMVNSDLTTQATFTVSADNDANGSGAFSIAVGSTLNGQDAVSITANDALIDGSIAAPGSAISFNHASETGIALGTSTSGGMWLENAELARMSGDSLIIGSFASTAGPIDVVGVAAADFAGFTGSGGFAVSLLSGNTIAVTNPSSFSSLFVSGVGGQMRLSADLSVGKLDTLIPTLIDGNRSITGTDQIKLAAVDGQSFGSDNLTLNATNIVNVTGDIGISSPLSTVTATANAITLHDVTTLDDQTYTGAVSFNSSYETNGGDFTINGPGTIDGPGFLLDLFSGNALFTGPLNAGTSTGPHDVQIFVNNGGTITFQDDVGGTMPLSSFALIDVNSTAPTGNATLKNVTTSGFQSYSLPVNVSSTYQGADIFFSNGITVAGGSNLTVNATGRIDIAGAVNSANGTPFDVTLNADTPQTGTDDEGVFLTGANFNLSGGNFNSGGLFTDIFETLISSAANVTLRGREDVTVASSAVLAENDISIIGTAGGPGDFIVGETGTPPLPSLVPGQSIFDAGNNVLISAALKNSNFPGELGISAGNLLTFTATNSGGIGVNSAFGIFNLDTSGDLFAPNLIINSPDAIQVGAFDINGNESNITDSVSFNVTSTLGELDFVGGQMNFPVLNGSAVRAITVAAPLMTTGDLSLIADSAGNNPDGHVHIQNDLTSGGNLTLSGATDGLKVETNNPTLQANQTVSLIGALESPFGNNSLTVTSTTGSVFLFDDTSQTLPLGGLTINAGSEIALQDVTSVGPQSYTGLTRFNSDYVTNGSDFTITGNTIVNADSSVTTGGGNILFTGDINSGVTIADLLLNANGASSSGTVTLNGPVGNAFPLDSLGLFGASGTLSGDRVLTNSGITIGTNLAINLANPTTGFEQEFLFAADFNRDGTGLFSVTSSGSISDPSFAGIVILAADVDIAGPVSSNDIVDISATGSLGLGNATGQQMTIDNGELSRITSPDSIFLGTDIVVDGVDLRNIGFLGLYTGVLDPTAFTPQNLSLPDGFAEIDTLVDFSNGADITFTGAPSQFSEIEILATDNIQFNSDVSGQNGFSLFLADLDQNGTGTIGIAPQAQVSNLTAQEGIVFAAADIDLQGSVTANADSGRVAISSRGGTTSVGSASGGLSLSGAELSVISTNELGITGDDIIVGDVSADQTANINQLGVATAILDIDRIFIEELENATADFETDLSQYFNFSNAGSVLFNGTIFAVQDLAVRARDAIGVSAGIQSSGGVLLTAGFLAPNNPDARIALNADIQTDLGIRLESGPGGLFIDGTVNLASNGPVGLQGIAQSSGSPGNLNITTTNAPVLLENDTSATAPLASLTIDAGTADIGLQDVTTVGPQNYTGNVFFNSVYRTNGNNFTVTGNVRLLSNTAILTSNGNVSLGPVNGAQDLVIDAGGGTVSLNDTGALAPLNNLSVTAGNMSLGDVTTTEFQLYDGAVTFNSVYTAGIGFTATGAATLASDTFINANGGSVLLNSVDGPHTLAINAGDGDVGILEIGTNTALAGTTITGGLIAIGDSVTNGNQLFTGTLILANDIATGGGNFAVNGTSLIAETTTISSAGGNIAFNGVIESAAQSAGTAAAQNLGLDAGNGNILFGGNVGGAAALGTLTIASANDMILNGTMRVDRLVQNSGTGLTNLGFNSLAATGDVAINTGNLTGRIGGTNVTLVASGSLGSPEQPLQLIADSVTVTSQSAFLNVLPPADSDPNTQVPVNFVGALGSGPFILNNTDFTEALLNNTPQNDFGIVEDDLSGFETVDEVFEEANDTISNVIDDVVDNDGGDPLATAEEEPVDDTLQDSDGPVQNNADLIFTDLVEDEGFEDSNFRLVSENSVGPIADDEEEDEDSAAGCACN